MGAPFQEQVDELIALGLRRRWSVNRILIHLLDLERMTDKELGDVGVWPGAFLDPPVPRPDYDADGNMIVTAAERESVSTVSTSPRSESNCHPREGDTVKLARPSFQALSKGKKSYEVEEVEDPRFHKVRVTVAR